MLAAITNMKELFTLLITCTVIQIVQAQSFVPAMPDTVDRGEVYSERNFPKTLGYVYLLSNYRVKSDFLSPVTYENSDRIVCAFSQDFSYGIQYTISECEEGRGRDESIAFPRMSTPAARAWIMNLYEDPKNTWIDEFRYEPPGAGCLYRIEQNAAKTIIHSYCGC